MPLTFKTEQSQATWFFLIFLLLFMIYYVQGKKWEFGDMKVRIWGNSLSTLSCSAFHTCNHRDAAVLLHENPASIAISSSSGLDHSSTIEYTTPFIKIASLLRSWSVRRCCKAQRIMLSRWLTIISLHTSLTGSALPTPRCLLCQFRIRLWSPPYLDRQGSLWKVSKHPKGCSLRILFGPLSFYAVYRPSRLDWIGRAFWTRHGRCCSILFCPLD